MNDKDSDKIINNIGIDEISQIILSLISPYVIVALPDTIYAELSTIRMSPINCLIRNLPLEDIDRNREHTTYMDELLDKLSNCYIIQILKDNDIFRINYICKDSIEILTSYGLYISISNTFRIPHYAHLFHRKFYGGVDMICGVERQDFSYAYCLGYISWNSNLSDCLPYPIPKVEDIDDNIKRPRKHRLTHDESGYIVCKVCGMKGKDLNLECPGYKL